MFGEYENLIKEPQVCKRLANTFILIHDLKVKIGVTRMNFVNGVQIRYKRATANVCIRESK